MLLKRIRERKGKKVFCNRFFTEALYQKTYKEEL